jgi:hypothetical protein
MEAKMPETPVETYLYGFLYYILVYQVDQL